MRPGPRGTFRLLLLSLLADFLSQHRDSLVNRFKARARELLAPSGISDIELENHLPSYLDELTQVIRQNAWPPARHLSRGALSEQHGRQRLRVGFSLDAVTREYGLLRDCIFEQLEQTGLTPTLRELRILSDCLSAATADSVTQYVAHSQALLRQSEAKFQAIIDNAPAAIYVKDLEGRCLIANRQMEVVFGRPQAALLGKDEYELLPRESAEVMRALDRQVIAANAAWQSEEIVPQADGPHTYLSVKFPLCDEQGRPTALCGISTDITERVRVQAELRAAQEQLRTVLGRMPIVLWACDAHGRFTLSEGRGLEEFGLKPGQQVGQSIFEFYRDFPWVLANVRRALAGEEFVVEQESESRWFQIHYLPHRDASGAVEGVMGLSVDVTDLKRAQQFQQRLLGIVGHDIRTPLSAILLSTQGLMRQEGLSPGSVRAVRRIAKSGERIEKLVATLVDYTRVQLGQQLPIHREHVCLDTLVEQICDEVQTAYPQRTLHCEATGDTCGEWNPQRLMQVVGNLLSNALAYSPADSPVRLACKGEQQTVSFEVHNEGAPIPTELLPHLFKPFHRGAHARSIAKEGLGLGLFIVREILAAHQATVRVTSTPNEGTTFTVELPRRPPVTSA